MPEMKSCYVVVRVPVGNSVASLAKVGGKVHEKDRRCTVFESRMGPDGAEEYARKQASMSNKFRFLVCLSVADYAIELAGHQHGASAEPKTAPP